MPVRRWDIGAARYQPAQTWHPAQPACRCPRAPALYDRPPTACSTTAGALTGGPLRSDPRDGRLLPARPELARTGAGRGRRRGGFGSTVSADLVRCRHSRQASVGSMLPRTRHRGDRHNQVTATTTRSSSARCARSAPTRTRTGQTRGRTTTSAPTGSTGGTAGRPIGGRRSAARCACSRTRLQPAFTGPRAGGAPAPSPSSTSARAGRRGRRRSPGSAGPTAGSGSRPSGAPSSYRSSTAASTPTRSGSPGCPYTESDQNLELGRSDRRAGSQVDVVCISWRLSSTDGQARSNAGVPTWTASMTALGGSFWV